MTNEVQAVRNIETHKVAGDYFGEKTKVQAISGKGNGGADFKYRISAGINGKDECRDVIIRFQQGNPEDQINGISNEALLAVVLDRLEGWQSGDFPSPDGRLLIAHLATALDLMQKRTKDRIERGVIGKLEQ